MSDERPTFYEQLTNMRGVAEFQEDFDHSELVAQGICHVDVTYPEGPHSVVDITKSIPVAEVERVHVTEVRRDDARQEEIWIGNVILCAPNTCAYRGSLRFKKMPDEPLPADAMAALRRESKTDDRNPKDIRGSRKPPLHLNPPSALIFMSMAMKDGAYKKGYGPYNWREKKISAGQYVSAAKRHLNAWFDGEEDTRDSKVPHLGAAMASIGILIDALTCDCLIDDRPKPGKAADLVERFTDSE